jgi:hypothetical protein
MSNLFVVRRVFPMTPDYLAPQSHGSYLRAFTTRTSAEECCTALDRVERQRRDINPFDHGQYLDECTSFPPPILCDWLLESGLTPPEVAWERHTWRKWWSVVAESATELQIASIWQAMDQVRFFAVVELNWVGDANGAKKGRSAYLVRHCLYTSVDHQSRRSTELDDEALCVYAIFSLAEGECRDVDIASPSLRRRILAEREAGSGGFSAWVVVELLVEE